MPLSVATIEQTIFDGLKNAKGSTTNDPSEAQQKLANLLAQAIVDAIKSADITVNPGDIITPVLGVPTTNSNLKVLKAS